MPSFLAAGFERHVVTGSVDSTGLYGQTDFALGWFERGVDMQEGVGAVLMGWWSEQAANWEQRPWRLLWTGLVDEPTALGWRDAVWCADEAGDED